MMYMVTVKKDAYDETSGVEVAGIFDDVHKARKARNVVAKELKKAGFEDGAAFVVDMEVNKVKWYSLEVEV